MIARRPPALRPDDAPGALRELSWFAIRQPAIMYFLERRLWTNDGDLLALGLDAACRLHDAMTVEQGIEPTRVTEASLREGLGLEPPAALASWVAELCTAAPVVLAPDEEATLTRVVGAVAWGLTSARCVGVGDSIAR